MEANKKTQLTIETIDPTGDAADRFEAEEFAGRVKQHLMQGRASWQKAREPGERGPASLSPDGKALHRLQLGLPVNRGRGAGFP